MYESVRADHPITLEEESTIANALSGGIGLENRHTLRMVRELVDEHVLVDDTQIRRAMAFAAVEHKLVVEGGGAVAMAAVLSEKLLNQRGPVAVVVSGGNVDPESLSKIMVACDTSPATRGTDPPPPAARPGSGT